jgi:hypothetical protein
MIFRVIISIVLVFFAFCVGVAYERSVLNSKFNPNSPKATKCVIEISAFMTDIIGRYGFSTVQSSLDSLAEVIAEVITEEPKDDKTKD